MMASKTKVNRNLNLGIGITLLLFFGVIFAFFGQGFSAVDITQADSKYIEVPLFGYLACEPDLQYNSPYINNMEGDLGQTNINNWVIATP